MHMHMHKQQEHDAQRMYDFIRKSSFKAVKVCNFVMFNGWNSRCVKPN